jgi:hypothetical protein
MLHNLLSPNVVKLLEYVDFSKQMLDAGYSMLDDLEYPDGEIQRHPVSSLPGRSSESGKTGNQYQGSASDSKVFLETASANCLF